MFTVEQILRSKDTAPFTAAPDTSVRDAARMMADANVGCVVVVDGGEALGIFSERDLVRRVVAEGLGLDATRLSDVMSSPVCGCEPTGSIPAVVQLLNRLQVRHLPVLHEGRLVGLISARDVLNVLH